MRDTPDFYYGFAGPRLPRAVKPSQPCQERDGRKTDGRAIYKSVTKGLSGALRKELLPLK